MKRLTHTLFGFWVMASITLVFAQLSDHPNYHSGNRLRVTFFNSGEIAANNEVALEWPIASGHEYLEVAFPVVAVSAIGNHQAANFSRAAGYCACRGVVAMNYLPDTWPATWQNRPPDWAGHWNGFFGKDRLTADQESYYVLEDQSLGLRLTVRGWQWSHYLAQDMFVLYYELENVGSTTYEQAAMGFFAHPQPGGDGNDDRLLFDPSRAQITAVDMDNTGSGTGFVEDINDWSPVGRLAIALLETPGNSRDGIDNDGDGMVDESRSDDIDNDGDWRGFADLDSSGVWEPGEPLNDDVGADGVPNTGDPGEGDGIPTHCEPNFDETDVHESDQIGLTSLAAFAANGFNPNSSASVWSALSPNRVDSPDGASEVLLGSGTIPLAPGDIQRFSVIFYLSENELDQSRNQIIVDRIARDNYRFPVAPPPPRVTAVPQNKAVTLYWDTRSEEYPDFEGYKIYRSTDPGFNDIFRVTDDKGNLIYGKPVATFDKRDAFSGLFPKHAFGFRYFLGKNTGLTHQWTDNNVLNNKKYYYAVVAFNHGAVDSIGENHDYPTESTKSIVVTASGEIITDINTVVVTPTVESMGYEEPQFTIEHTDGVSTASMDIQIVDRRRVKDGLYRVSFDSIGQQVGYTVEDVTNPGNTITVIDSSINYSREGKLNENDPMIDGFRLFLFDDSLAWDSLNTGWKSGESNWRIRLEKNDNLGNAILVPFDYEVRFGEMGVDTALFNPPFPIPFQVWNVTENRKENVLIIDQDGNGGWDSGEPIYIVKGRTLADFKPIYWTIILSAPADSTIQSVPPQNGDVAFISTRKPFNINDVYTITTQSAQLVQSLDKSVLDSIKVVPNPYIVTNRFEQLSIYTGGQFEHKMAFIHLPQQCTIRIFNLRGYLIDTIEHNSAIDNGSEYWNLRAAGSNKVVAYGMYIYHIDAPGIGEKIGRFAIIR